MSRGILTLRVREQSVNRLYDVLWTLLRYGAVIEFHKDGDRSTISVYCLDTELFRDCRDLVIMIRDLVRELENGKV